MSKGLSINDDSQDEEEPLIPDVPEEVVVGNRKYKRRKGARSSYGDRLRELQKKDHDGH